MISEESAALLLIYLSSFVKGFTVVKCFTVSVGFFNGRTEDAHCPTNGIRYAVIRCFTKEWHQGNNYFTLSVILALRAENKRFSILRCTKTDGTQLKLNAACFVIQSCPTEPVLQFFKLLSYLHTANAVLLYHCRRGALICRYCNHYFDM